MNAERERVLELQRNDDGDADADTGTIASVCTWLIDRVARAAR